MLKEFDRPVQLGFGYLRVPMENGEVNLEASNALVDRFLEKGYRYFDAARGYMEEKCEFGIRESLVKRHPRDSYWLADKLTDTYIQSEADILPFFQNQLETCGVDFFDFYLIHSITAKSYEKYLRCNSFETVKALRDAGKIRHIGISYHDGPELLEQILTDHPEVEFVQIQFNYEDYDDPGIQSRKVYEVCVAHEKPVVVMEPLKGGNLTRLPEAGAKILESLGGGSQACYGLRFVAAFPQIKMILSGMAAPEQIDDNVAAIESAPLNETELAAIAAVQDILKNEQSIRCTACRYCVKGCPMNIPIPEVFSAYNAQQRYHDWNSKMYYSVSVRGKGRASACIGCGKCENICPQHLPIREHLKAAAELFDRKKA